MATKLRGKTLRRRVLIRYTHGVSTMGLMIDVLPPIETAVRLEPEELAVPLIECLCRFEANGVRSVLNRWNFLRSFESEGYFSEDHANALAKAYTEAWVWLEREGLLAPDPGQASGGWVFVTRRGRSFRAHGDVAKFKAASLLPSQALDATLASKVRPAFLRAAYDSAVFEAFKEVEVRVREAGGFGPDDIGVNLMRDAFQPGRGPLADLAQVTSEQEGTSHLFAGAIACFKNPGSHRNVNFNDPVEVGELIALADVLVKIVERRRPKKL